MNFAMTPLEDLKKFALINALRSCQLFTGVPLADLKNIAAVTVVKSLESHLPLLSMKNILSPSPSSATPMWWCARS